MKVTYCDFCGEKMKKDDETSVVNFELAPRYGGVARQRSFEGCTECVDEVHGMVLKITAKIGEKK